jgi:hypothetical protein
VGGAVSGLSEIHAGPLTSGELGETIFAYFLLCIDMPDGFPQVPDDLAPQTRVKFREYL